MKSKESHMLIIVLDDSVFMSMMKQSSSFPPFPPADCIPCKKSRSWRRKRHHERLWWVSSIGSSEWQAVINQWNRSRTMSFTLELCRLNGSYKCTDYTIYRAQLNSALKVWGSFEEKSDSRWLPPKPQWEGIWFDLLGPNYSLSWIVLCREYRKLWKYGYS